MTKRKLLIAIHCMSFTLLFNIVSGQIDCYNRYYSQGDAYLKKNYFDQAIAQFQVAKQCKALTISQVRKLDSLITDAKRKRDLRKIISKKA